MDWKPTTDDKALLFDGYERALRRWSLRVREIDRMEKDDFQRGWLTAYNALWDLIREETR